VGRPDFTSQEWQLIYRCCRALRIDGRMLPHLRDFLAQRLAGPSPELAAKVRRLGDAELRALCEAVRARQARDDLVVLAARRLGG
jgi:hypothetical protein